MKGSFALILSLLSSSTIRYLLLRVLISSSSFSVMSFGGELRLSTRAALNSCPRTSQDLWEWDLQNFCCTASLIGRNRFVPAGDHRTIFRGKTSARRMSCGRIWNTATVVFSKTSFMYEQSSSGVGKVLPVPPCVKTNIHPSTKPKSSSVPAYGSRNPDGSRK